MSRSVSAQEERGLPEKLRRRLWVERVVLLALVGVFVALYLGVVPGGRRVCLIAADGRPVVVVETRAEAERILSDIQTVPDLPMGKARFIQDVTLHDVSGLRHPPRSDLEAIGILTQELELVVRGAAILADDRFVVALPEAQEAVTALSLLLRELSPSDPGLTVYFKEKVSVEVMDVPPAKLMPSAEEAVGRIMKETSPKTVHRVKRGESAWQIARTYGVRLERLAHVNPGRDLERIREGETLRIPGSMAPVTVVARKEIEEPAGAGGAQRTRKVRVTYENGVEVKREVIGGTVAPVRRPAGGRWRRRDEATR